MARKKLYTYDTDSEIVSLKFGANVDNTRYTIGGDGTEHALVEGEEIDVLYQSIVMVASGRIWMRGKFIQVGGSGSERKIYCSLSEYYAFKDAGLIRPDTTYCITNIDCDFEATEI